MAAEFNNETLHVIDYYNNQLININQKNIDDVFNNEILKNSSIDINANNETAKQIYDLDKRIAKDTKDRNLARGFMIFMRIFGAIAVVVGIVLIVMGALNTTDVVLIGSGVGTICFGILIFGLSWLVKKKYKQEALNVTTQQTERSKQYEIALNQLANFKTHFYAYLTISIFEKTYPLIKFDKYFSEDDYKNWTLWLQNDVNSSCLYCLSGNLNTNPFIILKTKKTAMYDHVYTGSISVMVRRTRYVNNRSESYMASKVITATAANPAPKYWSETKLFYKNNAGEDLNFENNSAFKNEKKANKFFKKNKDMEPMENAEFDKLFPCHRSNETSFRTLFSLLAQEEMCKLLKVKSDYLFTKNGTLNIIASPTFDDINLSTDYSRYDDEFDYEKIKNDFYESNKLFFSNIYFMFAPLLVIPLYQQYRYRQPLFEKKQAQLLSFYQNENIVNTHYDELLFAHEQSKTTNILKTKRVFENSLYEINEIIAYGYRTETRTVIVTVSDFEAGIVHVPVRVIDYFSVKKSTFMTNSYNEKIKSDFLFNKDSSQAKPLNVDQIVKRGFFISILMKNKEQQIEVDRYKEFLNSLKEV